MSEAGGAYWPPGFLAAAEAAAARVTARRAAARDLAAEDRRAVAMLAAEAAIWHLREGGTEDGAHEAAVEAVYQAGADPDLCRRVAEFERARRAPRNDNAPSP